MKTLTLEDLLVDLGDRPISSHGGHERILTLLRISFNRLEVIESITSDFTGYEALEILNSIEDNELKTKILAKTFKVRDTDIHDKTKWKLAIIVVIITLTITFFVFRVLHGDGDPDGETSELLIKVLNMLLEWLSESPVTNDN